MSGAVLPAVKSVSQSPYPRRKCRTDVVRKKMFSSGIAPKSNDSASFNIFSYFAFQFSPFFSPT